uniref:Uncharacterized protein n=1 Tax=Haptolina brevifila TaxID=156173 RepID=A0A7S2IQA0_9EUKA
MSHLVSLLHTIHLFPRKICILLAGESENDRNRIRGGDTELSDEGKRYSAAVCELVRSRGCLAQGAPLVLSGTLRRYQQMVGELQRTEADASGEKNDSGWARSTCVQLKALNELCFGSLEQLAGGKLRQSFPDEFASRAKDPLRYRYPGVGGESYMDRKTRSKLVSMPIAPPLLASPIITIHKVVTSSSPAGCHVQLP